MWHAAEDFSDQNTSDPSVPSPASASLQAWQERFVTPNPWFLGQGEWTESGRKKPIERASEEKNGELLLKWLAFGLCCSCSVSKLNSYSVVQVQLFAASWTASHQASCVSPSPEVCLVSCSMSWWCHPTISSSVTPTSLSLNLPSIKVFASESALCIWWSKYYINYIYMCVCVNIYIYIYNIKWFVLCFIIFIHNIIMYIYIYIYMYIHNI